MTQRIAATTALAVVAAIATSAWLTVLVVASYESGLSAAAGGQLAISGTPDGTRDEIERALKGAAHETEASLLLALSTETPEEDRTVFVALAGEVEEPLARASAMTTPLSRSRPPPTSGGSTPRTPRVHGSMRWSRP